jgi:opacity protein-like surface antigen
MGKFAVLIVLTLLVSILLLPGRGFAQATPDAQTPPPAPATPPAAQQPPAEQPIAGQEPTDVDTAPRRRVKPRDFKSWTWNVGAGGNLDSGTTRTYVRGGGVVATAGVARNGNKYLGLRGDFFYANLPLRDSALQLAQASGANNYLLSVTLDPVFNIPASKLWGGYVLFGPGFYHRSGSLDSSTAVPGSTCNGFWEWWGACANVSIPLNGSFVNSSQNEFGYNVGAGITRKVPSGVEIYAEYRLMHGSHNGITTDVRPITIGVRW